MLRLKRKRLAVRIVCLLTACACVLCCTSHARSERPETGPATEERFSPLKVPRGFTPTLFACDPLIEYPSAIALGPRTRTLFVAVDYLTGLGVEIQRRDEIRLIEDTDEDGYADRADVFADGFNSIQGLTYHGGTVFAMHAPLLTALRDTDGDGAADDRRDLLAGLGLPPEENPPRLHCANGIVMGHDGWLYLALGDHGCDVRRAEGDRLVLQGGGILRCRPDGRDLHVFARGLRNIYDVALDSELNVFVRDNENDGGDYKIRVCHGFFGADHGYPYLYYERPDEALPPLADLGLGSSAGGLCYLECQFPAEYRGNLFFCEWGRAVVRYRPQRSGSAFAPLEEIEFASGANDDPYGFKPTDLVVARDGSLFVADWADGQRPRRGRGRIYRIAYNGNAAGASSARHAGPAIYSKSTSVAARDTGPRSLGEWIEQLDSPSYYERIEAQMQIAARREEGLVALRRAMRSGDVGEIGRLHAVWILARHGGAEHVEKLFRITATDPAARVRAQAVRALADLCDPMLTRHRLAAGTGDPQTASRLADLAKGKGPEVLLEVVVALGRLRWSGAPAWLEQSLNHSDPALSHAAMQTLRRSKNWPAILRLIDEPSSRPIRALALRAMADRTEHVIVDGLIERLRGETNPERRLEYAVLLSRVYKKRGPWSYWGYRPPPRPANTVAWERTAAIEEALDRVLGELDPGTRLTLLRRMQREKVPTRLTTLRKWLHEEREPVSVAAILDSLREHSAQAARPALAAVVRQRWHTEGNRLSALAILASGLGSDDAAVLVELARMVEDGPVLAEALRLVGERPQLDVAPLLLSKLASADAQVRAAAIDAIAARRLPEAGEPVRQRLDDADVRVRRAAALAMGKLSVRDSVEQLLGACRDADSGVRRASIESLRLLREPRGLPIALAALEDRETEMAALECIGELGGPAQVDTLLEFARRNPSSKVLAGVARILNRWWENEEGTASVRPALARAIADLHGSIGALVHWRVAGPLSPDQAIQAAEQAAGRLSPGSIGEEASLEWDTIFATAAEQRVRLALSERSGEEGAWLGYCDIAVAEPAAVEFLGSSGGRLFAWLNGISVYSSAQSRENRRGPVSFEGNLREGLNRLLVLVVSEKGAAEWHLQLRHKAATEHHEKLIQTALAGQGDVGRGRELFFDVEKTQCVKCHRVGDRGERIGPELTGVGSRFSRIHIIESILQPSRTIAPGFETLTVVLKDGRLLSGTRVAETGAQLTLGDSEGRRHLLARSDIDERRVQSKSTMPDRLEEPLSPSDFLDIVAFLASLKDGRDP